MLYEKKNLAKQILPQEEWWRIVNCDLSNENSIIDWTHEREWRIKGDLEFDLNKVILIIPHGMSYEEMTEKFEKDTLNGIKDVTILDPILT